MTFCNTLLANITLTFEKHVISHLPNASGDLEERNDAKLTVSQHNSHVMTY